jgi:peptidoglycan hydrolase-like protein with peptidoglycan-binding domain
VTAAGAAAVMTAAPASASGDPFATIRQCESGGNYSTNTGNGFYGAYQFTQSTWNSLGYSGLPSSASAATQDQAARQLAARSGFGQWPVCGAGQGSYSGGYTAPTTTYYAPQRTYTNYSNSSNYSHYTAPAAPSIPASVGDWPDTRFTTALAGQKRADVLYWQKKMRKLGFKIKTDGQYGPESANAARFYQLTHHLQQDGVVGPDTWLKTVVAKKI